MNWLILVPRNAGIALLVAYRTVISPLYGDVCRYYPSCSSFTLQAVQQYGLVKGSWLGARRIARCHPWAEGGIDDIPEPERRRNITKWGFVTPHER